MQNKGLRLAYKIYILKFFVSTVMSRAMSLHLNLESLLKTPIEARDSEWEKAFLLVFPDAKLKLLDASPKQGPDGMPYLLVAIDSEANEPAKKILEWLSQKGVGLVVNPQLGTPDYVFTHGMLWNYRERGEFLTAAKDVRLGQIKYEKGQTVYGGAPSKEYLPEYIRSILREFFKMQGLENVKILMLSADQEHYDLCFSLESLGRPPAHEHRGILETVSWFLPSHYSLVVMGEQGLPQFHSL